jgi:hypothetical protein
MTGFTSTQRVWLKELGVLVGTGLADAIEPEPPPAARRRRSSALFKNGTDADDAPIEADIGESKFVEDVPSVSAEVLRILRELGSGRRSCAIKIVNNSSRIIRRGLTRHDKGDFHRILPPDQIGPGEETEFLHASPEGAIPILNLPTEGSIANMDWLLDGDTTWFVEWRNPVAGGNNSSTKVSGVSEKLFSGAHLHTNGHAAAFRFTLTEAGVEPKPTPKPKPGPSPDGDAIQSSCLVTVKNDTAFPLRVRKFKNVRGDFMNPPNLDIAPNGVDQDIITVETPRAPDGGCAAFIEYEVGDPPVTVWRVEWDNPEGAKNTASATFNPPTEALASVEGVRQGDENVKVGFVLRPGRGVKPVPPNPGPVPPNPVPIPPPEPEPDFNPEAEAKQPTLRKGKNTTDGWVEYLQKRLNETMNAGLKIDGDFGQNTHKAVVAFQTANNLKLKDGVVGNETWSALREGPREEPGTDGRKPNTFVEKGAEGRWNTEQQHALYLKDIDMMILQVESVGTAPIDDFLAKVEVTFPDAKRSVKEFKIGPPDKTTPTGQGNEHTVKMREFRTIFKVPKDTPTKALKIRALLPKELGSDLWEGGIVEG